MQKFRKPQKATVYYRLYNTKNGGISHEHHYRHRPRLLCYQNSPLLVPGRADKLRRTRTLTKFIPAHEGNYTKDRKAQGGTISEITIHHCASILTIDALGALWQREGRKGSSHYGVSETSIGQYVHENDVAWTNGNWEANCRAVTIETSNSAGAPDWPVSDTTFNTLVTLVADIARRNSLGKLVKGENLTWHSMYAATACPGPYLSSKLQKLVDKANEINGF